MISLLFKFYGDSSPLRKEAEKAKGEMAKAGEGIGKAFGSQLKGAMMAAVGVNAIIATIRNAVSGAMEGQVLAASDIEGLGIRENMALKRASAASGLSREQMMMVGRERPELFAKFIKQFEPSLGESDLSNLAAYGEDFRRGKDVLSDQIASLFVNLLNRGTGLAQSLYGSATGDEFLSKRGRELLVTGIEPMSRMPSPSTAFIGAETGMRASLEKLNEIIATEQRLIEETERVREAVERN